MRIFDFEQGSEEWHAARCGLPTTSRFDKIITASKAAYSSQSKSLIATLIAEQLPGYERPYLSEWVQRGNDMEPRAVACYEFLTDFKVEKVGFVKPDDRDDVGSSPDRLVNDGESEGLLEIKCPKAETLVGYHIDGTLPNDYKAQVQGQLWITGLPWCDFFAWHPELDPFQIRVERDEEFIKKLVLCVDKFCKQYQKVKEQLGQ
jgi:hypothetical protein